jgi:hypothetical protein
MFIIFRNDCEFYKNIKWFEKKAFCDLQFGKDGLEDGLVPLCESLYTKEKTEGNSDLKNLPPLRLRDTILKKNEKEGHREVKSIAIHQLIFIPSFSFP